MHILVTLAAEGGHQQGAPCDNQRRLLVDDNKQVRVSRIRPLEAPGCGSEGGEKLTS